MKHRESDLQIRCMKWFRYQYPAFARLMFHPHNEGNGLNRRQQTIANAEGVTKGVADLILALPTIIHTSLAIELKTKTGRQSPEQKTWQRLFEAAGGRYAIVRSYDDFVTEVTTYLDNVLPVTKHRLSLTHEAIQREADEIVRQQLRALVNK